MARRHNPKPGEGQGGLLGVDSEVPKSKEILEVDGLQYLHEISPATTLEDYYGTLAGAVKSLGRARSNGNGFTKLPDGSKPVKEFSWRLETGDPDETRRIVGATQKKHRFAAQDKLNKQNRAEYLAIVEYGRITNEFSPEYIVEEMPMPPAIEELEFKYFDNPDKSSQELESMRRQLQRRAERYSQTQSDQVA